MIECTLPSGTALIQRAHSFFCCCCSVLPAEGVEAAARAAQAGHHEGEEDDDSGHHHGDDEPGRQLEINIMLTVEVIPALTFQGQNLLLVPYIAGNVIKRFMVCGVCKN